MAEIFETPVEIDDLHFYVLPVNTSLYRGDNYMDQSIHFSENKPLYLGVTEEDVRQYGMVFEIKTTRPYNLVALDNRSTMNALYRGAPEKIQKILKRNYGYDSHIRNSDVNADNQLIAYLCKKGYDGYATNKMSTDLGGIFHREVALCHPQTLQIVKQITPEEERASKLEESKLRELGKEQENRRKEQKKRRRAKSVDEENDSPQHSRSLFAEEDEKNESPGMRLFGIESYDSPVHSPVLSAKKLGFSTPGGGKRKTMRKRKNARKTSRKNK